MTKGYSDLVFEHYCDIWSDSPAERRWQAGPVYELPEGFRVLEFPPHGERDMWTYATCDMSQPEDDCKHEVHLFSPYQEQGLVELLTSLAHYHRNGRRVGLGDSVNWGRPWLPGSNCTHALISLPYLDGPRLEWLPLPTGESVRFLWVVPITPQEAAFKKKHGVEALEHRFEEAQFNYVDPARRSVVA